MHSRPPFWNSQYVDKVLLFGYPSSRTATLSAASDALRHPNWLTFLSRLLRQMQAALPLMWPDKLRQIHSCLSFQEQKLQDLATTLLFFTLFLVYYSILCTLTLLIKKPEIGQYIQ